MKVIMSDLADKALNRSTEPNAKHVNQGNILFRIQPAEKSR